MIRPFSFLCLSDPHLVPFSTGETAFTKLKDSIEHYFDRNPLWKPDFIIIAGDLVAWNDRHPDLVRKHLDRMLQDWHLHPSRVIIVPGNHDKVLGKDMEEEEESVRRFTQAIKSDKRFGQGLMKKEFGLQFKAFGDFYLPFVEGDIKDQYQYLWDKEHLGEDLSDIALTSGLKVFEQFRLCFLCINTEWTFLPSKKAELSSIPFLCSPIVHHSIEIIKKDYPDYTLVSLMHRNPFELSWEEYNRRNNLKPDIIKEIYNLSDIILTGHNHVERVLAPHMMENKAQLFNLGSIAVPARENVLEQYRAAMLTVNPFKQRIQLLNCQYENDQWTLPHQPQSYGLRDKYIHPHDTPAFSNLDRETPLTCFAKSTDEKIDIIPAISELFQGHLGAHYSILCLGSDKDAEYAFYRQEASSFVDRNDKSLIVLYAFSDASFGKASIVANAIKSDHLDLVLASRLIIETVLIELPDFGE